jgi:RNA polymerase sigma-70 factor (ECF subfamily)
LPDESRSAAPEVLALVAQARSAHPDVEIDEAAFLDYLDAHRQDLGDPIAADDLYLACACVHGDERAIRALDAELRDVAGDFAGMAGDPVRHDDFKQVLREKLLVGERGGAPKLAEYSGRGSLRSWLRIVAKRTYLDELRRRERRKEVDLDESVLLGADDAVDLELRWIKERYRVQFRSAFASALGSLEPRERNMLRSRLLHGLSNRQIAQLFDCDRATVTRQLAAIRERLLVTTKAALMAALRIAPAELDSVLRLIQSRLEITLSGLQGRRDV